MQTNFYAMGFKSVNYAKVIIEDNQTNVKKCPMCQSVMEERKYNKFKLHFLGKKEGDLFFSPYCHIVSSKLLKLLYDNEISGFVENEFEFTKWLDRNGKRLDKDASHYKELIVTGRAGYLKDKDGKELVKCPKCGYRYHLKANRVTGLMVDEEWDGSDIFYFRDLPGKIIVTEKVKCLLEKNKMKNVAFESLNDFTLD